MNKEYHKGVDITVTQSTIWPYYAQIGDGTSTAYWTYMEKQNSQKIKDDAKVVLKKLL